LSKSSSLSIVVIVDRRRHWGPVVVIGVPSSSIDGEPTFAKEAVEPVFAEAGSGFGS